MKELTILSGKGGTGKTTVCAAFAALAANKVLSDCDVDAADFRRYGSARQLYNFTIDNAGAY